MPDTEATFGADHRNVSAARAFVKRTLAEWDATAFEWAAVTLVSELATNAVLHARTSFTVVLRLTDDLLRISVSDESVRLPQQRNYGTDATTGRGLHLLHDLSSSDGVEVTAGGKTVWCELRAGQGAGTGEPVDSGALAAFLSGEPLAPDDSRPGPVADWAAPEHREDDVEPTASLLVPRRAA